MTTLNISLPESMRMYIEETVTSGGYSTASEYIRQLVQGQRTLSCFAHKHLHQEVDAPAG
jgi:putative addiction module CopG family antidote